MKMFWLWIVNQLGILAIIIIILIMWAMGSYLKYHPTDPLSDQARTVILIISAVLAIVPAFMTAKFAKNNYDEMLSSGFIRWTSSINLWKSKWKFYFKTLLVAFLFYGAVVFLIGAFFYLLFN